MTLLQHHLLALTFTAVTTFGLGLLVFLARPSRRLNQIFGFYSLSIVGWAATDALVISASNVDAANFWGQVEWCAVTLIGPTFMHTVFLLTKDRGQENKWPLRFAYLSSAVVIILHLSTDWIGAPPQPVAYVHYFNDLRPLGYLIPAIFLTTVNIALRRLRLSYKNSCGQRKKQLRLLFYGSLIGYLGGSFDWTLTFSIYIPFLNPFGIYAVPLYSIATTYAVLQHRLFDVNLVIRRSLVYSLLVTSLTVGYFGLVYAVEKLFQATFGYQSVWISVAAFALMTLLFQPLKIGIQRLVDRLIFRAPREGLIRRMEQLEKEAQQTDQLRAVATLAAGLCHELRNPLQAIQTHAEYLPERYDDPRFRQRCSAVMRGEIARINDLLRQLMEFAKPKPPAFRPVAPLRVLDSTLDLLSNDFLKRGVRLEKRYEANSAQVQADADQLRQVILNLLLNALQAVPAEGGRVTVKTREEKGWYVLEVSDNGPGIDARVMQKLFEPFNTSKPDGIGLGLSVAHSIVREHRGHISARSAPSEGTTFVLQLPVD